MNSMFQVVHLKVSSKQGLSSNKDMCIHMLYTNLNQQLVWY